MRILQLSAFYPPGVGGVENSVYQVVTRMQNLGHHVDVITAQTFPRKSLNGYSFRDVLRIPVLASLGGSWGEIKICPTLIRELSKIEFDIAHVHTPPKFFAESLAFYENLAKHKVPYLISIRLINTSLPSMLRALNDVYRKTVERVIFHEAARVVVQSNAHKLLIMRTCGLEESKIAILPNGVDASLFTPSRSELSAGHRRAVLLFVGRLVSQKGLEFLLQAVSRIREKVPDVRLIVVGDGPMRSFYVNLAKKLNLSSVVVFAGSVSHEEMPKFYSRADIFVMPSLSESFPNAVLEAMAMQKPIIATKVGVIPEMLKDGQNALLVSPGQTSELEGAIVRLLTNEPLASRLGDNARKLAKNYTWEAVVAKSLSLYSEVLREFNMHHKS